MAVHEAMILDDTVEKVLEMVDVAETLIIVTADHGHVLTQSGYAERGSDIRGKTTSVLRLRRIAHSQRTSWERVHNALYW